MSTTSPARTTGIWIAIAVGLGMSTGALSWIGGAFAPPHRVADMPVARFSLASVAVGLAFLLLVWRAIPCGVRSPASSTCLVTGVFAVGLGLRLALLVSEPILEIDYARYLWDGGVTAHGFNPYAVAPARVAALPYGDGRIALSQAAGDVFERISYAKLTTIYPPGAQAAFALAHLIAPWSLTAWRLTAIAADCATFALLVVLLREVGRSAGWTALYWWNPLALKEIANSAHMEAILLPWLLAALVAAVRGRHLLATACLGFAIATKLWPLVLAPIVLRPLLSRPRALASASALLVAATAATLLPMWLGGLDHTSGLVAFAADWATNSALFPRLESLVRLMAGAHAGGDPWSGRIARGLCVLTIVATALWQSRRQAKDAAGLVRSAYIVVSVLLLLAPAQFPWYVLWVLPLAAVVGGIGWPLAAALMPLYYLAFHFHDRGGDATMATIVLWGLWMPVWLALAWDWRRGVFTATDGG